jgi:hypothetical protein
MQSIHIDSTSLKFLSHTLHCSQKLPKQQSSCIMCCLLSSPKRFVGGRMYVLCPLSQREEQCTSTCALLTLSKSQSRQRDVLATSSRFKTVKSMLNVPRVISSTRLLIVGLCALLLLVSKNGVQELRCVLLAPFSRNPNSSCLCALLALFSKMTSQQSISSLRYSLQHMSTTTRWPRFSPSSAHK